MKIFESVSIQIRESNRPDIVWKDDAQLRFLRKFGYYSWVSAPDNIIDRGIAKITINARAYGFHVDDELCTESFLVLEAENAWQDIIDEDD